MTKRLSDLGILMVLVLIGFCLKGWYIGETSIGTDESFSIYSAQASVTKIISVLNTGDNPPLWEILLHYWNTLWGVNLLASRILSLIFNVLNIVPLYFLGERYIGKHVGIIASLLFLSSSFGLFIAHEARVYSLIGFLVSLSSLLFLELQNNPNRLRQHLLLAVVNMLIFYSHYLGVWIIVVQVLSLVLIPRFRAAINSKYLYQYLTLAVLCIPQLPTIWNRLMTSGTNGTWISKSGGIADIYYMILKYTNAPVMAVVFILLTLVAAVFARKQRDQQTTIYYLTFWLWIPLIISFLLSYKTGFFLDRYFYFVTPALYLLGAACIHLMLRKQNTAKWLVYGLLCIGMFSGLKLQSSELRYSGYHKDVRPLATLMQESQKQENTAILVTPEWFTKDIIYYYDFELFTTYFDEFNEQAKFKAPLRQQHIYCTSAPLMTTELADYNQILMIDENQGNLHITDAILTELGKEFAQDTAYSLETRRIFKYTRK